MKKSIRINYLLNTAYQILILLVPLVTTPYISRKLGANGIGIYSYTYSVISYFVLVAVMGTASYAQRTIAYYQNDIENRSRKFFDILSFRCIGTGVCVVLYIFYLLSPLCKYLEVSIIQILYLLSVAIDVSWLFQGMEDFKKIVLRNTIMKIINIALIFLFVKCQEDATKYTLILAGMNFIANLSIWGYVPRYIKWVPISKWSPFGDMKEIFSLFVPTIAIQIYTVLDKTMIGYFSVDAIENGYYEQTEKVVRMALAVVTSLGTVMIPRIAQLYHEQDFQKIKDYLEKSCQFIWFLGIPIMFGLMGCSHIFVPVFYGSNYEKVMILLPVYSSLILAVGISNICGCQFLIPTKKQNVYTRAVIVSAIVNLVLNCFLIPRYLSVGAAIASVIGEYIGAIVMLIYMEAKGYISIKRIIRDSVKNWISGLIMFFVVLKLCEYVEYSILSLIGLIASGCIVYFTVLFLLKDMFFVNNVKRIIKRISGT